MTKYKITCVLFSGTKHIVSAVDYKRDGKILVVVKSEGDKSYIPIENWDIVKIRKKEA